MTALHRWLPFCVFFLIALGVGMACFVPIAFAGPVIDGAVDISPVTEPFLFGLVTAIGAMLLWLFRWVVAWLKLSVDSAFRAYVQDALEKGIAYARNAAVEWAREHGEVPVRNRIVETAVEYVLLAVPGGLKWLGIDQEGVRRRIEARFPHDPDHTA